MEKIIEKLDAIEAANLAKVAEVTTTVDAKIAETVASFDEKVAALEAKVASINTTPIIKTYKSISQEVNRMVKGQLAEFMKGNGRVEKEIKLLGCKKLFVFTNKEDERVINFYKKNGFSDAGWIKDYQYGQNNSAVFLLKYL